MVFVMVVLVWSLFGACVWFSRKEQGNLLNRMSFWLYKKCSTLPLLQDYFRKQDQKVLQILVLLHPGEAPVSLLQEYYTGKIRLVMCILAAGSLLAAGAETAGLIEAEGIVNGQVTRAQAPRSLILEASVEEDGRQHRQEILLELEERVLKEVEAEALYQELLAYLEEGIAGDNPSLTEIRRDLYLPGEVEGYPFLITWNTSERKLVDSSGNVYIEELENAESVRLDADISYGPYNWQHSWQLILLPPVRTEQELFFFQLNQQVKNAQQEARYEDCITLPEEIQGKQITWREKAERKGMFLFVLALVAAALVYCIKDRDLQEELSQRKILLKQAYPALVNKYALFLGAGLTVRGAFLKICGDYLEQQEAFPLHKKARIHPLYEEMLYSCNELAAGVSESKVYESFGRRTGLQEYTRLCSLLNQNLKKGNTTLVHRLKEEGEAAARERIQYRKRQGEEAGTKLLLPMVMMLLMVLVMIMLPAFSGLGI